MAFLADKIRSLKYSLLQEPDEDSIGDLRAMHWSESPWLDEKQRKQRKQRNTEAKTSEEEKEEEDRALRERLKWLTIFFDLVWTITFANLSSSTPLTTLSSLINYGIFLALCWTLWMTQVLYDVKYLTKDWYHLAQHLLQLVIFGALAAFTKDFNAFKKEINPWKESLDQFVEVNYSRKANLGISMLFAATRILLAMSYVRAWLHLPKDNLARSQRIHLLYHQSVYLTSSLIFAAAYFVVLLDLNSSVQALKVTLWAIGLTVEIVGYLLVPEVDNAVLYQSDHADIMGERISTLTTIILGEGLNSLGSKLILTASNTGFAASRQGRFIMMLGLIILFAFLLYYGSLRRRIPSTRGRSRVNVLLHFPLHLSIIILVQSLKNNFVYASLRDQTNWFQSTASTAYSSNDATTLDHAFRNIGMDLNATLEANFKLQQAANGGQPTSDIDTAEAYRMVIAQAFLNIFKNFDEVSDEMSDTFTRYIYSFNATARVDIADSGLNAGLLELLKEQLAGLDASSVWITLSAGTFLVILAMIILISNQWLPQHRYIWAIALSHAGIGTLVAALTLIKLNTSAWSYLHDNALLSVFVAVAFGSQFFIDQILILVADRSYQYTGIEAQSVTTATDESTAAVEGRPADQSATTTTDESTAAVEGRPAVQSATTATDGSGVAGEGRPGVQSATTATNKSGAAVERPAVQSATTATDGSGADGEGRPGVQSKVTAVGQFGELT